MITKHTRIFLLTLTVLTTLWANSQSMTAYHDIRNQFYTFEAGITKRLEFNYIQSYKVGGNAIGYVDNLGVFKIYSKGSVLDTRLSGPSSYTNTDYLLTVNISGQLKAFENGKLNNVTNWAQFYHVGDSIIIYSDKLKNNIAVYYQGQNFTLEENLASDVDQYWVADNIAAYIDNSNAFKAFYHGEIIEMEFNAPLKNIQLGRDLVSYVNENTQSFELLYKGELQTLEEFEPTLSVVGDQMVAYHTLNNEFKIFYDGTVTTVGYFRPENLHIEDNVCYFIQDNLFKVFYAGKIYTLESYIPSSIKADFHTLCYLDPYGKLKRFYKGETTYVTEEPVLDFDINQNVITYKGYNQRTNVWFMGGIY